MTRLTSISILVLAATLGSAQTTPAAKTTTTTTTSNTKSSKPTKKKSGKHAKPEPVMKVEPPAPPPPPPTLAQQMPVPPTVSYKNGLLSIDAPNSTLGDILSAIRRATGAVIEGPSSVGDRVIVHLGPGQPRQVVASLLGSSRFDFIVMGTPQQPNGVNRLVLMARQGGNQPPVANNVPAPNAAQAPPVAADSGDEDEETPERDENSYEPPSQPAVAQPQGGPAQAPQLPPDQMAPQQGQQQQQQQPQDQNQEANPNTPKTPEQLYKELQNLERQRQQQNQNQNQNQNNEPPPPQ